eukprot:TRINITY_DN12415_c0_g1_i1.p1 TRINITY_DN12415_c0_g1~~TRINITY_DN12415_c0_g1_i1.p1  ORF type:complete len:423 (-),score=49.46 TRINITY_DN12415_c0_g1_i1:21-1289(-)
MRFTSSIQIWFVRHKQWMVALVASTTQTAFAQQPTWSAEVARSWMQQQPWRLGANYLPRSAANVLEMWDRGQFSKTLEVVAQEFELAKHLGFTTMRIFLHEEIFYTEGDAYLQRIDQFLEVMDKFGLKAMVVLFDAVWRPDLEDASPLPNVHNSAWVQCPTHKVLRAYGSGTEGAQNRLRKYVESVVATFREDRRVVVWDLYNEPSMFVSERWIFPKLAEKHGWHAPPSHWLWDAEKLAVTLQLMMASFEWARAQAPSQPLTAGVWTFPSNLNDLRDPHLVFFKAQLQMSDVISFHCYCSPDELQDRIALLQSTGRPVMLTEFVARSANSTYQGSLPVLHRMGVWGYAWGFVRGRSQTEFAWDTWATPEEHLVSEPKTWFHDLLDADGKPYDQDEIRTIWWHTSGMNLPKLEPVSFSDEIPP